ncbi:MAG: SRPBCC family protein [Gemmatales bacterium]|nr:Rieske 2Fe-2S domain-containing protein [Gemmatales bacterium]MDW7994776.1 SRPBCC family protein [Gemmatales bacterium]
MTPKLYHLLQRFRADLPLSQAHTIPASWYTDAELAEWERRAVFTRHWLVAGRSDQVAQPGQFFTLDLAGWPLVVVRGEDGVLRGFYNVCRHRAARVAVAEQGTADRFRCRYHGWTYDLAGNLRGVPEFDGVEGFCREENGLIPVQVAEWPPLIFVHLGQPSCSLEEYLAPMPDRLRIFTIEKLHFVARRIYDLHCNWKVFVDNYLDGGYHVLTLHRSLAAVLDYKHYTTETFRYCSVQASPMRAPDPQREDASAAGVRKGQLAAYWWLYPNFMLNAYEGYMDTNLVLPLGVDRCRVIFDFYFAEQPGTPQSEQYIAESIAVADRVQQEDMEICEDVQRGLASGVFDTGRYSLRRESGIYHFHQLLAQDLRSDMK